jgi:CheY-like chemotaxis protein
MAQLTVEIDNPAILVVDANPAPLHVKIRLLSQQGTCVIDANNGTAALFKMASCLNGPAAELGQTWRVH